MYLWNPILLFSWIKVWKILKNIETPTTDVALVNTAGMSGAIDVIVKLRDELAKLRTFIGYTDLDVKDGISGNYQNTPKDYSLAFGYTSSDSTFAKVKTVLDYVVAFKSKISKLDNEVSTNTSAIGKLKDLKTTDKTDLVKAINELDSLVSTNSKNIGTVGEIDAAIKNKTNNTLVSALNSLYSKVLSDESNITTLSSKIGTGFSSTNTITTSIQTIQDLIGTSLSVGDGNTTLIKAINNNYTLTTKNQEDIKSINKNLTAAEENINKNTAAIGKIANDSVVKSVTATPASYNTYSLSIVLNAGYKMIVQDDAGNVSYNGTCTFNVADLTDSKTFIVTPLYAKNSVDLSKKNIVVHVDYTVGIQANDDLGVTETKCTVSTTNWI